MGNGGHEPDRGVKRVGARFPDLDELESDHVQFGETLGFLRIADILHQIEHGLLPFTAFNATRLRRTRARRR